MQQIYMAGHQACNILNMPATEHTKVSTDPPGLIAYLPKYPVSVRCATL